MLCLGPSHPWGGTDSPERPGFLSKPKPALNVETRQIQKATKQGALIHPWDLPILVGP